MVKAAELAEIAKLLYQDYEQARSNVQEDPICS